MTIADAPTSEPSELEDPAEWMTLDADEAIPRLFELHGRRLHSIGLRLCGDPTEAEDLVQEVFLRAWTAWPRFRGESKTTTWLWTIATRVCSRRHRLRAGEPVHHESFEDPATAREVAPESETVLSGLEARDLVERALPFVPEHYRMPLVLKELGDFSLEEVGRVLGLPSATVKTRVHRGRVLLRETLLRLGMSGPDPPQHPQKQSCLDLLAAKQEALDRGVPFPMSSEAICERCRQVFAHLDEVQDLCRRLGADAEAPTELLERVRRATAVG